MNERRYFNTHKFYIYCLSYFWWYTLKWNNQSHIRESSPLVWASYQIREVAGAHAPGMLGTFSPPPLVSDPDMHHGTCVTHVPWCMPGSLTSRFLLSRRRGKTFPAFPAHAQPAILRIWQEAHWITTVYIMFIYVTLHTIYTNIHPFTSEHEWYEMLGVARTFSTAMFTWNGICFASKIIPCVLRLIKIISILRVKSLPWLIYVIVLDSHQALTFTKTDLVWKQPQRTIKVCYKEGFGKHFFYRKCFQNVVREWFCTCLILRDVTMGIMKQLCVGLACTVTVTLVCSSCLKCFYGYDVCCFGPVFYTETANNCQCHQ